MIVAVRRNPAQGRASIRASEEGSILMFVLIIVTTVGLVTLAVTQLLYRSGETGKALISNERLVNAFDLGLAVAADGVAADKNASNTDACARGAVLDLPNADGLGGGPVTPIDVRVTCEHPGGETYTFVATEKDASCPATSLRSTMVFTDGAFRGVSRSVEPKACP